MNYIQETLPQMRLVKMESSSRDQKQKQARHLAAFDDIQDEEIIAKPAQEKPIVWDFTERRSGEDRRQNATDRGRWLESRIKQNRRQTPSLYMQI